MATTQSITGTVKKWGNGGGLMLSNATMKFMEVEIGTNYVLKQTKTGVLIEPEVKRTSLAEKLARYDRAALLVNTQFLGDARVGAEKFA